MRWTPTPPTQPGWYFCQCRPCGVLQRAVAVLWVSNGTAAAHQQEGAISCNVGTDWLKDALWGSEPLPEPGTLVASGPRPSATSVSLERGDQSLLVAALMYVRGQAAVVGEARDVANDEALGEMLRPDNDALQMLDLSPLPTSNAVLMKALQALIIRAIKGS